MTDLEMRMISAAGLTEEDFKPQPTAQDLAESAYLRAEYNSILLEMMEEDNDDL